jgi:valyl-tRNA synthetase
MKGIADKLYEQSPGLKADPTFIHFATRPNKLPTIINKTESSNPDWKQKYIQIIQQYQKEIKRNEELQVKLSIESRQQFDRIQDYKAVVLRHKEEVKASCLTVLGEEVRHGGITGRGQAHTDEIDAKIELNVKKIHQGKGELQSAVMRNN